MVCDVTFNQLHISRSKTLAAVDLNGVIALEVGVELLSPVSHSLSQIQRERRAK
jgi:hypothetical protein